MTWEIYWLIFGPLLAIFVLTKAAGLIAPFLQARAGSDNPIVKLVAKAYWPVHEASVWASIYEAHRKAGHDNPSQAANEEIFLRGEYLERFRDEASAAYVLDKTDLDTFRTAFIKDNLMAKTTILDAERTASLRAAIRDMPANEAYHKPVYDLYVADLNQFVRAVQDEAEAEFGAGGYTPLERRVLRSRG